MMRSLILCATALVVTNGVWREEEDEVSGVLDALAPVGADTDAAASPGGADTMMKSSGGPSLIYDELYDGEDPLFNKSLCKVKVGQADCKQDKEHRANCFWSANRNECRKRMWGEKCKRADTVEECAKNELWADRCYWNTTRIRCLKKKIKFQGNRPASIVRLPPDVNAGEPAPIPDPTPAPTYCDEPDSEIDCAAAAEAKGLEIGGAGYAFAGSYGTRGCYYYTEGTYGGRAYYSTNPDGNRVFSATGSKQPVC